MPPAADAPRHSPVELVPAPTASNPGPYGASLAASADDVLAVLAENVPVLPADTTVPDLDRLFRTEPSLRFVLLDVPAGAMLIERLRFEQAMNGRLGFGRLLHANRFVHLLIRDQTVRLDAATPIAQAAATIVARRHAGLTFDAVVIRNLDGAPAVAPVARIFERLAEHHAFQSLHDQLTGLPNRAFLMERLRTLGEEQAPLALLFVDLDRFKEVNDRFGHEAGDQVLAEFGRRLRDLFGDDDLVVRLGGDEFAVLTDGLTDHASVGALAEKVVERASSPFTVTVSDGLGLTGEQLVRIGASVGVAFNDGEFASPADLRPSGIGELILKRADLAMYQAKMSGRGGIGYFAPALVADRDANRAMRDLERRLRAAIGTPDLSLHYQPVVDLLSGRIIGTEALARWTDPDLGSVPPDRFIAAAESSGAIIDLGRWVLEAACAEAASWPIAPGGTGATVAVNLSAVQLADPGIVADVTSALNRSGLDPRRLCLEITETAAIGDLREATGRLRALRELGVQLALDDFGTGHSSLTMLRTLPLHTVKVDRSFTQRVDSDAQDALLVRLVIDTAHSLGLRVCVEGVETEAQARQLAAMGADSAQGWYFGRPEPTSDCLRSRLTGAAPPATISSDGSRRPLLAVGASDELVLVTTPTRVITYASASCVGLLGRQPVELVGTTIASHLHPDDAARSADGNAVPGLTEADAELGRYRHRDGSYRWMEARTQMVTDDTGRVTEALSVLRDVTEAVEARHALLDSETKFRGAFDNAPIGMALNALDGTFLRVNGAFAELVGYEPEDLLSMRVSDLTHTDDQDRDVVNTDALVDGTAARVDVAKRYLHSTGLEIPVRVRASVVEDRNGRRSYIVAHVVPR